MTNKTIKTLIEDVFNYIILYVCPYCNVTYPYNSSGLTSLDLVTVPLTAINLKDVNYDICYSYQYIRNKLWYLVFGIYIILNGVNFSGTYSYILNGV